MTARGEYDAIIVGGGPAGAIVAAVEGANAAFAINRCLQEQEGLSVPAHADKTRDERRLRR